MLPSPAVSSGRPQGPLTPGVLGRVLPWGRPSERYSPALLSGPQQFISGPGWKERRRGLLPFLPHPNMFSRYQIPALGGRAQRSRCTYIVPRLPVLCLSL